MIRDAKGRSIRPYLATIPPMDPAGVRAGVPRPALESRAELQRRHPHARPSTEGVTLVDVYQGFGGDLSLLGPDGLHPVAGGLSEDRGSVLHAIKQTLETSAASTTGIRTLARGSTAAPLVARLARLICIWLGVAAGRLAHPRLHPHRRLDGRWSVAGRAARTAVAVMDRPASPSSQSIATGVRHRSRSDNAGVRHRGYDTCLTPLAAACWLWVIPYLPWIAGSRARACWRSPDRCAGRCWRWRWADRRWPGSRRAIDVGAVCAAGPADGVCRSASRCISASVCGRRPRSGRRGRAALPRHHAEPAARSRSRDREQPRARRLPRVLRRGSAARLSAPRPQRSDLLDSCARPAGAAGARRTPIGRLYRGAVVMLCLFGALAALAVFDLALLLAGPAAALAHLGRRLPDGAVHAARWLIFPEMPGALLVAWAALWLYAPLPATRPHLALARRRARASCRGCTRSS